MELGSMQSQNPSEKIALGDTDAESSPTPERQVALGSSDAESPQRPVALAGSVDGWDDELKISARLAVITTSGGEVTPTKEKALNLFADLFGSTDTFQGRAFEMPSTHKERHGHTHALEEEEAGGSYDDVC